MGQIRSKDIKKASFSLVEAYRDQLTTDFDANKKVMAGMNFGLTKGMRNRVAGYTTRLMKRTVKKTHSPA